MPGVFWLRIPHQPPSGWPHRLPVRIGSPVLVLRVPVARQFARRERVAVRRWRLRAACRRCSRRHVGRLAPTEGW